MPHEKQPFQVYADRYDAWYDSPKGRALFATEVRCLRLLLQGFQKPYLEVGVGTGRFAHALGIECGVDPSPQAIETAQRRGIKALLSVGESLPFADGSFGAVLLTFTLCFVQDPNKVLREIHRVLSKEGGLALGLLPKGTPWADSYAERGAKGDPFYREAHFYSKEEVERVLRESGFRIAEYRSTLFQPPGLEVYSEEKPLDGYVPGAGFVAISAVRF
ncbi:MAG: class I SAM-dependent methyltransferase [Chloroflexi bacterium]|nr:class I SAM-dependent methyltransferase [Chloroflexota bacterium]